VLHYFIFSAYHVVGSSMIPTLQDSNYLIISKVNHTKALVTNQKYLPAREQIIVFHYPKQPTLDFVKRVIALPGERVVIKEGKVRVYNQEHPDGFDPDQAHQIEGDYTLAGITDETLDVTVPPDNVFVLGDNRTPNGSSDSREWGFLPSEDIVGNVVLRLFPFNEIKTF
jgi:signal peptidase I